MSENIRINYVELPAKDLKAAEAFYAKAFGWTFQWYGEDYLAFNDGAMDGGFFRADLQSRAANGATLVVLLSDDLEETYVRVVEAGGTIDQEIFEFPGGRRFHFLDPNGNELSVWSKVNEA
ncbi:MAG: VOC family protein [Pseudomonadota bacterium]